ncbi:MAG: hypothetical protein ACLRO5_01240 [Collinsella sp.]|uniref:hypothetical protein n=1 Tax=Collinsella sp. TaxID=1965294 RepID=UPI0039907B2B
MRDSKELAVHEVHVVKKSGDGVPLTVSVTVGPYELGLSFMTSVKKAPRVGDMVRVTYEWGEDE